MIPIVFPVGVNWFNSEQAAVLSRDLTAHGVDARAVSASELLHLSPGPVVMIVNLAECIQSLFLPKRQKAVIEHLQRFNRRILMNYDVLYSWWFAQQFRCAPDVVTDVFDITMVRQAGRAIGQIPYRWVPEAFAADQLPLIRPWSTGRAVPWVLVGHATPERATFAGALVETIASDGCVYLPPLAPRRMGSGIGQNSITRLLQNADFYVWTSHHRFPFVEGLRALHAIEAGAIPVKIDPFHSSAMRHIPWVYPDLKALARRIDDVGRQAMYDAARQHIEANGTLGGNLLASLRTCVELQEECPTFFSAPRCAGGGSEIATTQILERTCDTPQ
jgi:hypothetical protein